jgi:predicted RNA-binding Zn-ribbon protein involved in translation (DUF1610 family)
VADRKKQPLKVIQTPNIGDAIDAPPILTASPQMIDYTCGHCGVVLLHAEEDRVHGLVIHCSACGSYNTTDIV